MENVIEVINLSKEFKIKQYKSGFFSSVKSLFNPNYENCLAIKELSFVVKHRFQLAGRLFFYILTVMIFSQLWSAAYNADKGALPFTASEMIWYITMTEWGVLSEPYIYSRIENDIKSGDISYFLIKPISYIAMRFFEGMGTFLVNLPFFGFVGIILASTLSGKILPISIFSIIASFLCILSGILSLLFQIIIGLCAFWLGDVSSIALLYRKFMYLLGGLLLPLNIYPQWIQKLAYFTPFPWMIYHRSQIIYTNSLQETIDTLLMLLLWIGSTYAFLYIFFKICLKKIAINGG